MHSETLLSRDLEVEREPGSNPVSAGEEVMFCQMTLILADVHIAELGLVDGFGGQPPEAGGVAGIFSMIFY